MGLWCAVLVGGWLRFAALQAAPPGLNQDEACDAWNAWCLLQTGTDQVGVHWPIFFTRGLGDNRSTLFLYILLPFQALFGLSAWSTRLPVALAGTLFIPLIYWLGSRLFDRWVGVAAAWLLALNPWAIVLSRWGIESCLSPFLMALAVAAAVWAGVVSYSSGERPRVWRGLVAGLLAGVVCYGYPALRLAVPVTFLAFGLVGLALWMVAKGVKEPAGGRGNTKPAGSRYHSHAAWLIGFAVTFGPLAWQHVFHGDEIGRRAAARWVWSADDSITTKIGKAAGRYAGHFGPDFLFQQGDHYEVTWPGGFGVFAPYCAVLMVVGVGWLLLLLIRRKTKSGKGSDGRDTHAILILLAWLVVYPLSDCLHEHMSMHALRASPGLAPLLLLAAVGLVDGLAWLWRRRLKTVLLTACVLLGGLAAEQHGRFLYHYFVTRNEETPILHGYHADLMGACEWLRARWRGYDAIVVTPTDMTHPYVVMMVGLAYRPQEWFAERREIGTFHEWDIYRRVGRFYFPIDSVAAELERLKQGGAGGRVLVISRPGECAGGTAVHVVPWRNGQAALEIREVN